ncbi:MAG: hypothetical protein ABIS27_13145 [Longimicrobiales bacterium]
MRRILAAIALVALAAPVAAQSSSVSVGSGVFFQGYSFDDGLGVKAANLLMVPFATQVPISSRVSGDVYTAYARGSALIGGTTHTLSGMVDTRVRLNVQATPWALVTLGANIPTGNATHTDSEARVAAVLASDMLGFREASWGLGAGFTTGVATAHHIGRTGVGLGVSYRLSSEFEPVADSSLKYTPGNEIRVRFGLDRNIAGNKLTGGVTFQNYSQDQVQGRDLFQPGNRWRGDLAYSFRTGASAAWTLYAADIWREHGDVSIDITDQNGAILGDSTFSTGTQNLLIGGLVGSVRLGSLSLAPSVDARMQTRSLDGGEGWLVGAGTDVPLRAGSLDITPGGRLTFGQIQGDTPIYRNLLGGELSLSVRWGGR